MDGGDDDLVGDHFLHGLRRHHALMSGTPDQAQQDSIAWTTDLANRCAGKLGQRSLISDLSDRGELPGRRGVGGADGSRRMHSTQLFVPWQSGIKITSMLAVIITAVGARTLNAAMQY